VSCPFCPIGADEAEEGVGKKSEGRSAKRCLDKWMISVERLAGWAVKV
jgi:hypothetical protein